MKQITVEAAHAGQRLDKYLHRCLPQAKMDFLYKMLRKKNITLNGKKAEGRFTVSAGDVIHFYFSDATYEQFAAKSASDKAENAAQTDAFGEAYRKYPDVSVLYEDEQIAVLNKPAGVLTQKAQDTDLSLNEWLLGYLLENGKITEESLQMFKPSVCNRLDRNTSGIVLCGKTLQGSQLVSEGIRDRSISKFYRTICVGELREECLLDGYLIKDEKTNKVQVISRAEAGKAGENGGVKPGEKDEICTAYRPLAVSKGYTLLEVELITGKTHQIRAHLADIGHPIIGDYKYGDREINDRLKAEYGLEYQLLHAYRLRFPLKNENEQLNGLQITAPYPALFTQIAKGLELSEYPFRETQSTAIFTCSHVLDEHLPILYVTHDDDGAWQFLCGGDHEMPQARIVSLKSIYELDPSIGEIADLAYGHRAFRNSTEDYWTIK